VGLCHLLLRFFWVVVANGDNFISNNKTVKHSRVLVINDDWQTSRYIASLLTHLELNPYRLLKAKGINQAINGISRNACEVVLLNYYWGKTAVGEKVLRWAKSKKPQIPIIVFTKEYEEHVDKTVIKSGAVDYLVLSTINPNDFERSLRYALERKVDFSYINYLTHHDHLTTLPNRVLFKQRLRHAVNIAEREQDQFALLLVDINNFKEINNVYGLDSGDQLLKFFADRLSEAVGKQGNVSRISGDEFAVILNNIGRIERVQLIAQKIIDALGDRVDIGGKLIVNYCSIGIALYPTTGDSGDKLQRNAGLAVAYAKQKKVSSYQFYSSDTESIKTSHDKLQEQFIKALATNEIGLYFNPRIDCVTDKIVGIEVNPYWSHPEKGLLEYEEFVWNGLNNDIASRFTEWLMATSFEYFTKLKVATATKLIFNIEFKGLSSAGFPEIVEKHLKNHSLSGDKLEFDLIKVSRSDHNNILQHCMQRLHSQGVTFGLNYFGTEEQSLSYIQTLPVSVFKLSADFIHEIENDDYNTLMAKALVDFSHSLGKQIVIEGLQSELPLNNIRALGFDYYKSLFSVGALSLVKLKDVVEGPMHSQSIQKKIKSTGPDG